jgi:hypothetical protein
VLGTTPVLLSPAVDESRVGNPGSDALLLRAADPMSVTRELAVEVIRLGQIRRGQLAEPASWSEPAFAPTVAAIVRQLAPIRSRAGLVDSFSREAARTEAVLTAYAVVWRDLMGELAAMTIRHSRRRRVAATLRGRV